MVLEDFMKNLQFNSGAVEMKSDLTESLSSMDWLTALEAAQYLRIVSKDGNPNAAALRNFVNQKRVPYYKPFGRLMFKRSELEKLVESSRQGKLYVNREVLRRKRGA
jgi:hypothetical protein